MGAIETTPSTQMWGQLATRFKRPSAIVMISAHWSTQGVHVMAHPHPETIHDFFGFPQKLFDVKYLAPGQPALASRIVDMLEPWSAKLDHSRGFDHGAWSVLVELYPEADIPVIQVSLDAFRTPVQHMAIGAALAPLRDENVLILGSGNFVHNLRAYQMLNGPASWGIEFDRDMVLAVEQHNTKAVQEYKTHPHAALAAPDWDHFVPILYILGARLGSEKPEILRGDPPSAGLTMTSFAYGLA